jgi:L-2-hydroxyglutarate oxidase LhgO
VADRVDVLVVGGGVIGLAAAWQLTRRQPGIRLAVVEAEPRLAGHQTSHNSGVVHAGIYYPPGSLKARLCRRGNDLLERFAADRGLPIVRNGKVVVAVEERELPRLRGIYDRAVKNGVPGVRMLNGEELRQIEPAAAGIAAVHSPATAVIDFAAVATALAEEVMAAGGLICTSWPVAELVRDGPEEVRATGPGGEIRARAAIVCAGLQADRLAGRAAGGVRVVPFRGSWFIVAAESSAQVRGSIYPVPDPRLPFLGVHVTRRIDGQVWAGPNAFLALSRSAYRPWAVNARDARQALGFPGLWRFAARHLRTVRTELTRDLSKAAYTRALARYLPAVTAKDLSRGPMGIRAQAMSTDGKLLDDFVIRRADRVLHVLNAPSPAATSSLAIGEVLATDVADLLGK